MFEILPRKKLCRPKISLNIPWCLRQGECEKLDFFGYCRCRVPCGQRWVLVGEPDARRMLREATMFAEYNDPWRKHGVMGTDDDEIMDKLEVAMDIQEESERLRKAGKPSNKRWKELNELTREITELRAKDFYGAASEAALGRKVALSWRNKYLLDREVRRTGRAVAMGWMAEDADSDAEAEDAAAKAEADAAAKAEAEANETWAQGVELRIASDP